MGAAERRAKQAAPANAPARCNHPAWKTNQQTVGETLRWVVPGSRLFSHFQVGRAIWRLSTGLKARAKAAPLQARSRRSRRSRSLSAFLVRVSVTNDR